MTKLADLPDLLYEERIKRRMTLHVFADHLNVPASTYHSWELGRHTPRGESLVKICNELSINANELKAAL